ncbi:Na+/H+ antiporter NhaA [Mangrovimicrobium sediminis]|uniref:Na(+)/H(+) antiporter NhaA n=1 Tax=Mangrovimicrobium sediminis TaxID=2562682 RepID=A0A4Z0LX74_9GAMM|nr:Na+/H+ antiporter NhaA [Haliea sp. SAOS-164]TGD71748.1 Na+/H+ antiporter NhaA [Haliea sp. SAOS-164]
MAKGIYHAPWEKAFDRLLSPLEEFIHRQTTSGILLMICAVIALVIANSPLHDSYEHFLHEEFALRFGSHEFSLSIHHWINEALMAMFFFVMGLELKRELLVGELSSPSQALLPIFAALGGMLLPALGYYIFNPSGPEAAGWGVPMATDIAFAIGALSLLGSRVPKSLITFLIALAIVDDLGAVAVIALFYTADLDLVALGYALLMTLALVALNLGGVRRPLPYVFIGVLLWAAMLASGIHATIAGIVVAFVIPIRPKFHPATFIERIKDTTREMQKSVELDPDIIHNNRLRALVMSLGNGTRLTQAPAQRLEHFMHLPVAYLVIPIFALANAGIPINFGDFGAVLTDQITLGVVCGLLLGKPLGIAGFTWLAVVLGVAKLPSGLGMRHIFGVGLIGGIGFTMSIFIADLGFSGNAEHLLAAKTGILLASALAGFGGFFWLMLATGARRGA